VLPELDKEDVKAVRSFLPGKLVGRTTALLALVLGVITTVIAIRAELHQFPDLERATPTWAYGMLIGFCFLAVVFQSVFESHARRTRRVMQNLAVKPGAEQTGYFRIGPYQNAPEDRAKFSRADQAGKKALEWIKKANQVSLYLCGDSGSGKSSLLNAFVLPMMREQGWTVVETRVWQDPQRALRDALLELTGPRRRNLEHRSLREMVEDAAKRAPARLLIVLDQFEEFVILAKPEQRQEFAAFVAELQSRPVKGLALLLVLRSEYQVALEEIGLPLLRSGENLFQVARFQFPAATAFIKGSGLDLQAEAVDRLLTSAAELDETPGLVRPITLNVIGYVLASGKPVAPSLAAGALIRRYIEQAIGQPGIRDCAPQLLEHMLTEQGTKRPRSEEELVADTKLRRAEVRAVLNGLGDAGLARPLDKKSAVWELSHDFVAHAVARFLGRRRGQMLRRAGAYSVPALLAISLLVVMWMSQSYVNWFINVGPYVLTAEAERALKPKNTFSECAKDCPKMIVIPPGEFTMGSPATEKGRDDTEGPQHKITIAAPFAVSVFEVTFEQWDLCVVLGRCVHATAPHGRGKHPVIFVNLDEAKYYVDWLSKMTGRPYRLLSEAEWEYAARAGSDTVYSWGDDIDNNKAVCIGCGSQWDDREPVPVGSFAANRFGLYDMQGNVWEWCDDSWHPNYQDAPKNGSVWQGGDPSWGVIRGGSWGSDLKFLRSAARGMYPPGEHAHDVGFRIARTLR
jgi:formylglycine-generating enzyme required for sulfatase activity